MDAKSFTYYIKQPGTLYRVSYQDLLNLVGQYPYCQNLRYLLVKKSQFDEHKDFQKNLQLAATFSVDRSYFYKQIKKRNYEATSSDDFLEEDKLELKNISHLNLDPLEKKIVLDTNPNSIEPTLDSTPIEEKDKVSLEPHSISEEPLNNETVRSTDNEVMPTPDEGNIDNLDKLLTKKEVKDKAVSINDLLKQKKEEKKGKKEPKDSISGLLKEEVVEEEVTDKTLTEADPIVEVVEIEKEALTTEQLDKEADDFFILLDDNAVINSSESVKSEESNDLNLIDELDEFIHPKNEQNTKTPLERLTESDQSLDTAKEKIPFEVTNEDDKTEESVPKPKSSFNSWYDNYKASQMEITDLGVDKPASETKDDKISKVEKIIIDTDQNEVKDKEVKEKKASKEKKKKKKKNKVKTDKVIRKVIKAKAAKKNKKSKDETPKVKGKKKRIRLIAQKSLTENYDIATETLAKLHVVQGNNEIAIKMYQQLMLINPEKSDFYEEEIKKLGDQ